MDNQKSYIIIPKIYFDANDISSWPSELGVSLYAKFHYYLGTQEQEDGEMVFNFAFSADEALNYLRGLKPFDVVLLLSDINMPGMNGLEVLKEIRADSRYGKVPVMMVTTESERANIVKAVQAGADNYLAKPFASEDLVTRILQTLGEGRNV